jgi:hypothetical protein
MRELLIDFSSSPFLAAEMQAGEEPRGPAVIADEVFVVGQAAGPALSSGPAVHDAQVVPALRRNFPAIQNDELRGLCWQSLFAQLISHLEKTSADRRGDLKVHAIFPQTWRATEAAEFRAALQAHGLASGYVAFETACLALLLSSELHRCKDIQEPDPVKVMAALGESESCRWWSFDWFRLGSPGLLCLTGYTPAWSRKYVPDARPDVLFTLGDSAGVDAELERLKVTGGRRAKFDPGSPMLSAGSAMLRRLAGEAGSGEVLHVEMAPALAWRWGADVQIRALSSRALLDLSSFPLLIEKECWYTGQGDDCPAAAFWLEAAWGDSPASWSPLASVRLPIELLRGRKKSGGKWPVKLRLQMSTPAAGRISLEATAADGSPFQDCSEFQLGSALS